MRPTLPNKSIFRFIAVLFAVIPVLGWGQSQAFTAGQAGEWIVPCGVTSITVHVYGAGGGGGGSNSGGVAGGGGGAGGYTTTTVSVIGGQSFSYNVGTGGAGDVLSNGGEDGFPGTSSVFGFLVAEGGAGGNGEDGGTGSVFGGAASGGTTNTQGGNGLAGGAANGGNGGTCSGPNGGIGGAGGAAGTSGSAGNNYGAGGGGGGDKDGGNSGGGNGAGGYILISWTVTALPLAPIITTATQTLANCDQDLAIVANDVSPGIGSWSIISGSGSFADATDPTTTISNLGTGATTIAWNSDGPGCTNQQVQITLTTVGIPSQANAGPDLGGCSTTQSMAATAPTSGTGTWSLVSGCGAASTPTSPTSTITGLCTGSNIWQWTVVNALCPSIATSDQVEITISLIGTIADAGPNQNGICWNAISPGIATLSANTPIVGTGTWSIISNTTGGSLSSTTDPTADITGINATGSITLQWTIAGGGCAANSDQVVITTQNCTGDEPCTALGLVVNSGPCVLSTFNNSAMTVSTGMPEPGCATIFGPDMWFAVTVPSSGQVQINSTTAGAFDELITIYDGTCSNLAFAGCVSGVGSNVYPLTYAGIPGSTIWVRVNEGTAGDTPTGDFQICAYEATTATISEVLPGVTTTVTCGQTLNFYDTGGEGGTTTTNTSQPPPAGNYTNNTGTTYKICPSDPSQYVSITFNEFTVESGFDKMIITSGADNVIAQWTANDGQGDVVTSQNPGECLTVYFQSDYIWTAEGWEAVVSCTNTPVASQINNECNVNNCTGGCGVWVCADGTYNTQAGAGAGIDEINEVTGGCWGAAGEVATSWFYFTTASAGTLEFFFDPSNNGHNLNFALYGPSTNGQPPCPTITGDAPIRCSFTDQGGVDTGMSSTQSDAYDGPFGNSLTSALAVGAGETYALVVDVYQNGQPPTQTTIDFGNALTLDCTPVTLPITLSDFSGINQGRSNLLSWIVNSQINNDFFTVERSLDGQTWEVVGHVDGAGTTQSTMFYSLIDETPYFPVTYYRLAQTDIDGERTYSHVIALSNNKNENGEFIGNLFPNPSSQFATFTYDGTNTNAPLNVKVINSLGQTVQEVNHVNLHKGVGLNLVTVGFAEGVYQVVFTQGNERQVQKLTILR